MVLRRLALTSGLLSLAACPPKNPTTGGGGATLPGVGCPDAANVFVVSYLTPEENGKGHTGWVLPLHDKVVDAIDGEDYKTIDPGAAAAAGVPQPPQNLWLLQPNGQPCKATVGSFYAAGIDAPEKNVTYGVELTGCNPPPDPANASAIAVVSSDNPNQCQVNGPRGVAQRLGTTDQKGQWQKPTPGKETPIPANLAALVPQKDCAAPGCEKLWSFAQVEVGGQPVAWAGAVNWLQVSDGCDWKGERYSGFFIVGPDGAPVKVTEGQEHQLALTAVLADKTGAKVLIAEGPGEYSTYALAKRMEPSAGSAVLIPGEGGGSAKVGRHLVWLRPHPDSFEALDHLGPVCPEEQPGAGSAAKP